MKSVIRLIYLIICSFALNSVFAQELVFDSTNFDFGTIAEDGGNVTTNFSFKNSGSSPVVIVSARTSCGCTTPNYSRQPLLAGQSSTIEVEFNPYNRPGHFSKTVEIITAPTNERYVLTITGNVTPRTKSLEERYPFDMGGGVRFAANYLPLSLIGQGEKVATLLRLTNTSRRAATISLKPKQQSGALEITLPKEIAAGESLQAEVAYSLKGKEERYGLLEDRLAVVVNGKESQYELIVKGHAIDAFTQDDRERAPIYNIDKNIIKLGEISHGSPSPKGIFSIENSGVTPLKIRAVDLGKGLVSTIKSSVTIEADQTKSFEAWIDPAHTKYGTYSSYITLTTNDPDQPVRRLRITGIIIEQ